MNPYALLAPPVQSWIDSQGWTDFSEIQEAAIPRISADEGVLLVASTASGKTEAAVLPMVSRILELRLAPIALLYVAPLKALINDQVGRVERILSETSLTCAWWHGELSPAQRARILRSPPHALLTTPESLEVMLSSTAYGHGALLGNVRYVLVDEIHAFAEADRGAQLVSLLARLEESSVRPFVRVALSATVGSPEALVSWLSSPRNDAPHLEAIVARGSRPRRIGVGVVPDVQDPSLTREERQTRSLVRLASVLERHASGKRCLIFTNARAMAERVTAELRTRGLDVHIHHGSVDQAVRRQTEAVFRLDGPKTIVATSTLELGIDIGDLELTVQLGAPATASSFMQRLGRSGRRADVESVGYLYALDDDEMPAALAVADLAHRGVVEALHPDSATLHVLFQQVIQLVRELDQASPARCFDVLGSAGPFRDVTQGTFDDLIADLVEDGFLELERGQLRIGAETERRFGFMNYRDFYSVFETDPVWLVRHGSDPIGSIDLRYPISENRENIFVLAGRKWHVTAIDRSRNLLLVEPAPNAKIPRWIGDTVPYSFEVMRRACELIAGETSPLEHARYSERMAPQRSEARRLGIDPRTFVVAPDEHGDVVYTYAGFHANRYLAGLLAASLKTVVSAAGHGVVIRGGAHSVSSIVDVVREIVASFSTRAALKDAAAAGDSLPLLGKYAKYLGRRSIVHKRILDLNEGAREFERLPLAQLRVAAAGSLSAAG